MGACAAAAINPDCLSCVALLVGALMIAVEISRKPVLRYLPNFGLLIETRIAQRLALSGLGLGPL